MDNNYDIAYRFTAKWEGGLSNDKNDRGGITNYGVSIVFLTDVAKRKPELLKELGIATPINAETIRNLKQAQAKELFRNEFWLPTRCDLLPLPVAVCVYDCAVNSGIKRSVKVAQNACNSVLKSGVPLVVDGILGNKTLTALAKLNNKEGLKALVAARLAFYKSIIANNPSQKVFQAGWTNRANNLLHYVENL